MTEQTSHISLTEFLNKKYVIEFLSKIQLTRVKKRHIGNDCLLKMMSYTCIGYQTSLQKQKWGCHCV